MATEKQINYINGLVNGLRLENMEWIKNLTLTGAWREMKIQKWLDSSMGTHHYEDEIAFDETVKAYNARLDEIESTAPEMDTKEASKAIDSLKNCNIVW